MKKPKKEKRATVDAKRITSKMKITPKRKAKLFRDIDRSGQKFL